jgi:hypothetical protein
LKQNIEHFCLEEFRAKKLADQLKGKDHGSEDKDLDRIEIADIVFAFNNADLIKLLKKRGKCIINQQFKK